MPSVTMTESQRNEKERTNYLSARAIVDDGSWEGLGGQTFQQSGSDRDNKRHVCSQSYRNSKESNFNRPTIAQW